MKGMVFDMHSANPRGLNLYFITRSKWLLMYSILYVAGITFCACMFARLSPSLGSIGIISFLTAQEIPTVIISQTLLSTAVILGGLTVFSPFINLAMTVGRGLISGIISVVLSTSYDPENSVRVFVVYIIFSSLVGIWCIMSCSEASCLWAYANSANVTFRDVYNLQVIPVYLVRQVAFTLLLIVCSILQNQFLG